MGRFSMDDQIKYLKALLAIQIRQIADGGPGSATPNADLLLGARGVDTGVPGRA